MVENTTKPIKEQRIAVLGGGPSGTAVCRAFKSAADKGADIPQIVCFEKQSKLGGQWNYSWRTGLDEHNEPVHSGMYRHLWTNAPKECLEFGDYSFMEHFGKAFSSFPPREVVEDYFLGRIKKAKIEDWIHFNTVVYAVKFHKETNDFSVTVRKNTTTDNVTISEERTERFDYVFTCTGHFHVPNMPYYEGIEKFQGRVLHSHDFRDASEFAGKRVMIVGASYSAEDIASQCFKFGCKDITCSYRTNPMDFGWPKEFEIKPLLTKVEGKTCTFKDGTTKEMDAIILCTGYKKHFPFMEESLQLRSPNKLWIDNCYKGMVFTQNPKLFYIGMQNQFYSFNMFDAQAWYARDVVLGKITVPSQEEQAADHKLWADRQDTLKDFESMVQFQCDHLKMLHEATDYPKFDYAQTVKEFVAWNENKKVDIMNFRDCSHKSAITGEQAPIHHTPWINALDDSMKVYLEPKKE